MAKYRVTCTMLDTHPRGAIIDPEKDLAKGADLQRLLEIGALAPVQDRATPAGPDPDEERLRAEEEARLRAEEEARRRKPAK